MNFMHEETDYKHTIITTINKLFPSMFIRPTFKFVKKLQNEGKLNNDLVIVEIGTDEGINAKSICKNIKYKKLFLIDPYFEEYKNEEDGDKRFNIAKQSVKSFDNVTFIRKTSMQALNHFKDNSIDVIYIDGNHDYSFVKDDVNGWYKKVKKGGIIGGHDFFGCAMGVILAITDFANENDLRDELNGFGTDWWFQK